MSPDAVAIAGRRIQVELNETLRRFAGEIRQKHEEFAGPGVGPSSMMIIAAHELARKELKGRALSAWRTVQRVMVADDADPSDLSRTQAVELCRRAITELSADVDKLYAEHSGRIQGNWPTLDEPREQALQTALSEIEIEFLAWRRKRYPLGDVLRAPRYDSAFAHWRRAVEVASATPPDHANAAREATLAVESLAKVVTGGNRATLGECLKVLRARRLLDPGMDKIIEGVWSYTSATPGIRHGGKLTQPLGDEDWAVLRPMIDGALHALLQADCGGAV